MNANPPRKRWSGWMIALAVVIIAFGVCTLVLVVGNR